MNATLEHSSKDARSITRSSRSNLAFAFLWMDAEKKRAMRTLYAFCRVVDDIVDERGPAEGEKREALQQWKDWVRGRFSAVAEPTALMQEVAEILELYPLNSHHMVQLIEGMEMDLAEEVRFGDFEALQGYCYRVASVVGLLSIEIMGYQHPSTKKYAVELGYGLQMTNILRDVAEDAGRNRIYLPLSDLMQFQVEPESLLRGMPSPGFFQLMQMEGQRAARFLARAGELLEPEDRRSMAPAELMRRIYSHLLYKMQRGHFDVFAKRYRLSAWSKGALALRSLWG